MGVREIAHAIRGRGPGNYLFLKQQQALRNGSVRFGAQGREAPAGGTLSLEAAA